MSKAVQVNQIREMKQQLQEHYDRFKALRASGQNEEALRQFNVTLKVASELMELSTRALKEIAVSRPKADDAKAEEIEVRPGKVLHFPSSDQVH